VKFKCNFGGIARDTRRDLRIVSTFIYNLLSHTLREINVGFWGHFAACISAHCSWWAVDSFRSSYMTAQRNDDMPGVESHLRELRDIPETPATSCVSRPDKPSANRRELLPRSRTGVMVDSLTVLYCCVAVPDQLNACSPDFWSRDFHVFGLLKEPFRGRTLTWGTVLSLGLFFIAVTAEAPVQSRVGPCAICGGPSGTATGFRCEYFGLLLSVWFHRCSTLIHPSPTLCKLRNLQRR